VAPATTDKPVRLDKWLWAARFFKTRALAKAAIENGRVFYDGVKPKPSRNLEAGAELTITQGFEQKTVIVSELSDQRRGAKDAALLYCETEQSIQQREQRAIDRKQINAGLPISDGRPTKKQRRQIHKFKESNPGDN
jgi:ribosome-associated heat shock protein Hsp15